MQFTLTLAWWHLPTIITVLALAWALFWPVDDSGYLGGIQHIFMLIPALVIISLAWALGAIFK